MRSSNHSGITLIEVVAGLALMGTLLTVILVGSSQHLRQLKAAQQKRDSVRMLDEFLATWSAHRFKTDRIADAVSRAGLPATGQFGLVGREGQDHERSRFRVELRRVGSSEFGSGSIIRLTVSVPNESGGRTTTAWAEVVVPQ